jgi:hypothetical protein
VHLLALTVQQEPGEQRMDYKLQLVLALALLVNIQRLDRQFAQTVLLD